MSVNKAILIGRLGRDPETRYTSGGASVCNFQLATEENWKDKSGERQKKTEWHRITVWGKQAEVAQQYLKKGALVFVEGRIESREWEKDGEKRITVQIVASNFRMLGDRNNGGSSTTSAPDKSSSTRSPAPSSARARAPQRQKAARPAETPPADADEPPPEITDEDIPF